MIEIVILDFDGLILDTESPFRRSWEEIYAEHGLNVPPSEWACLLGSSADPAGAYLLLEDHLGRTVDRADIRKRRMSRELELLEGEEILPGIRKLIDEAKRRGFRLAVASSSERDWVVGHLAGVGLLDRFEAIVCAEDVESTKPSPDLYRAVLSRLEAPPEAAIAFEDSAHGVAAAKAAGLFCVAVPNQVTRHLTFSNADLVVDSLATHSLDEFVEAAETHYESLLGE